jgi:hypothetical protein
VARLKFRVIQKLMTENLSRLKQTTDLEEEEKYFNIHRELKKSEIELAKILGVVISG